MRVNLHFRLAFCLLGLLLITKFSPLGTVLTVLVVSLQVNFGESILGRFSAFSDFSIFAKIGLGFCLGATLSTFIYVFVVTLSNPAVAIISLVLLFAGGLLLRGSQFSFTTSHSTSEELGSVKWLAFAALLGLSPNWFWTLPVAIWLAISSLIWSKIQKASVVSKLVFVSSVLSSGLFLWSQILSSRPNRAWFADDRFAEIFSFSLGKWGMSHNPMLISESISYHWFSFAWVGVLSNLTGVDVDVVLSLFAPVIVALACAVLGLAIIKVFISNTSIAICSVALAVFVDTERLFEGYGFNAFQLSSFSQFFSLALGLALLLIILTLDNSQLRSASVIVGVLLTGLVGSKVSSGLVASFGLGGVWLFGFFDRPRLLESLKFLIFGLIAPVLIAFVVFFGNPAGDSTTVFRRPGWPVGVSQDLWHVYNGSFVRYLPILIFLILAFGGVGFLGLATIIRSSFEKTSFKNVKIFLGFGLIIALLQMWIPGGGNGQDLLEGNVNTLYGLHFWLSIIRFVAIALVLQQFVVLWRSKIFESVTLLAVSLYLVLVIAIRSLDVKYSSAYFTPLLTTFKPAFPFFLALLVALLMSVFIRVKWRISDFGQRQKTVLVISNMALIAAGLLLSFTNHRDVSDRQQKEWNSMDVAYLPNSDFIAATSWLKKNAPDDALIASKSSRISPKVTVLTDRKDFAGVQVSFRIFGAHSVDHDSNFQLMNTFGAIGSCESSDGLRDKGVNYFLIDTQNSETPDFKRCSKEVFRNKTMVVYSFN